MTVENENFDKMLRSAGLRVTAPRLATMTALASNPHTDADSILTSVRAQLGTASKQAVYDVLHTLSRHHIVRRVITDGHGSIYELEHHDNHHHLVCNECGRIEDVPCQTGHAPCMEPPEESGVTVHIAEVVYRGLCSSCTAKVRSEEAAS